AVARTWNTCWTACPGCAAARIRLSALARGGIPTGGKSCASPPPTIPHRSRTNTITRSALPGRLRPHGRIGCGGEAQFQTSDREAPRFLPPLASNEAVNVGGWEFGGHEFAPPGTPRRAALS